MFASYLSCMLIEQFLYCWFGNQLIYKSQNIFNSVYNIPWINCDMKCKKNLLQFMTQTKWPIVIRARGFFKMNMSVFISVSGRKV
nr:unnamed protein product [Callosobruchus analis]